MFVMWVMKEWLGIGSLLNRKEEIMRIMMLLKDVCKGGRRG